MSGGAIVLTPLFESCKRVGGSNLGCRRVDERGEVREDGNEARTKRRRQKRGDGDV